MSFQLQMVQSRGSRGFRLAGTMATSMSFRASQIFTNCNYFPAEFSLVATLKISKLRQKVSLSSRRTWSSPVLCDGTWLCSLCSQTNEYIFSVVKEGSNLLLLGLRVSENHLHLVILSPGVGRRSRVTFKDVNLDDNRWHTVALAVTGPYATLTVDCGLPLEMWVTDAILFTRVPKKLNQEFWFSDSISVLDLFFS